MVRAPPLRRRYRRCLLLRLLCFNTAKGGPNTLYPAGGFETVNNARAPPLRLMYVGICCNTAKGGASGNYKPGAFKNRIQRF